jgi:hypothetical protein
MRSPFDALENVRRRKEALKRFAGYIVESFVKTSPPEELPLFEKYFKTLEGQDLLVRALAPNRRCLLEVALHPAPKAPSATFVTNTGEGEPAYSV